MTNLDRHLESDEELRNLFKKYDICNRTPYGSMSKLLDDNAAIEDIITLHENSYYYSSLTSNNNCWL